MSSSAASGPRMVRGADGVGLAVHLLGGSGPPVILAHATGFHGRVWAPTAAPMLSSFTVWALDQRGHGQSGRPADGRFDDWNRFALDLLAVVDDIGGEGWSAGGHSLGGGVALLAEAIRPGTFRSICCYEPVVFPPGALGGDGPDRGVPLAGLARKRRPGFESRQAAFENYRSKPPFAAFTEAALRAYVEFGFVDQLDGTVALACAREDEAAIFAAAPGSPTWGLLPAVRAPVAVLAGNDMTDPVARVAAGVARQIPRGGFRAFSHLDHFGPMVAPEEVGRVMAAAFLAGHHPDGADRPQ